MSLNIYTKKEDIPSNMKFIEDNDSFFAAYTKLEDRDIIHKIMKEIDQAEYVNEKTFISRDKSLGNLYSEYLSTGSKTLINIVTHPDICFDVVECGSNALYLLKDIRNGNVFWEYPIFQIRGNEECDFIYNGLHFGTLDSFFRRMDEED